MIIIEETYFEIHWMEVLRGTTIDSNKLPEEIDLKSNSITRLIILCLEI